MCYQQHDKNLIKLLKNIMIILLSIFCGSDKEHSLFCRNHRIVIPKQAEKCIGEWCHHMLYHLGEETHTELTLAQHFYWKNLRRTVLEVCSKCESCQFMKGNKKQYSKVPPKKAETNHWDILCIDCIGTY